MLAKRFAMAFRGIRHLLLSMMRSTSLLKPFGFFDKSCQCVLGRPRAQRCVRYADVHDLAHTARICRHAYVYACACMCICKRVCMHMDVIARAILMREAQGTVLVTSSVSTTCWSEHKIVFIFIYFKPSSPRRLWSLSNHTTYKTKTTVADSNAVF